MKPSIPPQDTHRAALLRASLTLGLIATVHAAWTTVDKFDTRPLGNINGQGGWVTSNTTTAQVLVDPGNSINKIMNHTGTAGAGLPLPVTIPENSTGTFFIRVKRVSGTNDNSFGLADVTANAANVNNFASFEVQPNVNGLALRGRDIGSAQNVVPTMQTTAWYKVWLVVTNAPGLNPPTTTPPTNGATYDRYRMFIQSDQDLTYSTQTEFFPTGDAVWNFRNGTSAALVTAQFTSNNAATSVYFDDLYIDNTGQNLTDPTFVSDPDTDHDGLEDAWEVFYFGSIATQNGTDGVTNADNDGLSNEDEETLGTNPTVADTDGDGLNDGAEFYGTLNVAFNQTPTNPKAADSDGDGFTDFQEINGTHNTGFGNQPTNPNAIDSDEDGFSDRAEIVFYATNPNNGSSKPMLLTLIGPEVRNGSFELLGPVPGTVNAARAAHWDTDPNGDVTYWNLWTTESTSTNINSGTETGANNTHGVKHAFMQINNAAYNLTDHVAAAGEMIAFSFDQTRAGTSVRGGLVYNSGTDEAPVIVRFPADQQTLTETTTTGTGNGFGNIYVIPAGSPAIGKKIGFALKSVIEYPHIDNVKLTLPAADADHDGLADYWEDRYFGNNDGTATAQEIALYSGSDQAPDNDGFTNLQEQAAGSDPTNPNSIPGDLDADGLDDEWEMAYFQSLSNPNGAPGADPDGDHDTNAMEETNGTNPTDRMSFYSSTEDVVPDSWKAFWGISAQTSQDDLEAGDPVGDGLTNQYEYFYNTNPNLRDTDGDGLNDGPEILAGANPLVQDTDGDGLLDGQETNSSPTSPDTDGDSFGDKYEVDHGSNPSDANSFPAQPAGFTLLEDFQGAGMTVGQTFNGVNGWFATLNAWATVAAEPVAGGGDQVGYLVKPGAVGSPLRKSLSASGIQIRDGHTGTLFFQLRCASATLDHSFGLSDTAAAAAFGDFEGQLVANAGTLRVRDGAVVYDSLLAYQPATWMNIWMVADNTTDTIRVYYQLPGGSQTEIVNPGNAFDFRNGVGTNALNAFLIVDNAAANNPVYIDNIFVDPNASNLAIPSGATKPGLGGSDSDNDGMADAWETTYFGGLGQTATGDFDNDGTDNLTEFRLGLIPNKGGSMFVATRSGGAIQWPSVEGVTFKIERSTTLGAASWTTLQATWPGTAGSTSYTDPSPPVGRAFYKITLNP
ncbi:hypothetical protein [Luteolibacter soli]|uniref:Uncharacterized protein n=1 Tax=Luteolibacter soli TaxID=3135280 RepID=A0ABU9B0M9_9BACT